MMVANERGAALLLVLEQMLEPHKKPRMRLFADACVFADLDFWWWGF